MRLAQVNLYLQDCLKFTLALAEQAIGELRRAGFDSDEIGIIGHVGDKDGVRPAEMRKPEWNVTDAMFRGGVLGGVTGIVVILAIPALSRIANLGFVFDVLGAGILGAGIAGMLMAVASLRYFTPKSRFYDAELQEGRFIITVKNPSRKEDAVSILNRPGVNVTTGNGS